ncbi:hydroxyethylthiazole kinase [Larsenimonas suaedae]|uniref:Hydroxyethylthiazole kinase n=1 Tax=Larsenimonas suaedae TaxID=1851019 RepID=A0ABU1GW11_9GAMM|nr:hydroxyethylthiazole kinase [Larsenimonas suaedae]MCM2973350.1 hydroxyethylthiazole kinase [Larsenimonas suaedae]MDR5896243.1 hydroxyethylthiazole kinase [Larsenimonas suaedae]
MGTRFDPSALLETLKTRAPLVHCLTNRVTVTPMANALLAIGAAPVMTDHPDDAEQMTASADALLINLGTPTQESLEAMTRSVRVAAADHRPWVLDPVGVGATRFRRTAAHALLEYQPTAVRGNASEIMALADEAITGRGVDTQHTVEDATEAANALLSYSKGVAISGQQDHLLTELGHWQLTGGSAWQPRVTGTGCVLGALMAAYGAVSDEPFEALAAAHLHAAIAAELAEARAEGPASFASAWLDALARDDLALTERAIERVHALGV